MDFDAVDALLAADARELFAADGAGQTPLDQAPRASWSRWAQFLDKRRVAVRTAAAAALCVREFKAAGSVRESPSRVFGRISVVFAENYIGSRLLKTM